MRGIAFKIFLSFWLIFAVLIASFALVPDPSTDIRFQDHLRGHGNAALRLMQTSGTSSCDEYAAAAAAGSGVRFALFDARGTVICRAPGDDVGNLQRYVAAGRTSPGDGSIVTATLSPESGERYVAAGVALDRFANGAAPPSFPYRAVAYAILISGVVCFAMARYLARPLQLVRRTSYQLAAGDLHARAGPAVGRRHDEIGDLVRDFDAMAARIETLVQAQHQLLSDISHELRSPLARLNVALELARRKAGPDATTDLGRIETEAERMNELIGRVLGLARVESDPEAMMGPVHLQAVIQQVAADAQYEAQRQNKSVELTTNADPIVHGHDVLVASIVDNVVRNALRYTPADTSASVTLSTSGQDAVITVRDHGPGVPDAELERIFSPFHRVESGRNRETGGVGLGLAIARRAVAVHHGTISAGNAPDGGLVVTVRLPLHRT